MSDLMSYDDALDCVLDVPLLAGETVPLSQARGRILSEALAAPADLPPFDNSAVDGYAVYQCDTISAHPQSPILLPVVETVAAGYTANSPLKTGTVVRIYTGAPMPEGADALVMVEDTETTEAGSVRLFAPGSPTMVRARGSDIEKGAIALPAGSVLTPGSIGLLAALNIAEVFCPRRPRVALLTTGDEVIPVGTETLQPGQIRDANGFALTAAIEEAGADLVLRLHARDSADAVRETLERAAAADVIIASGGVSVGDRDYVKTTLQEIGTLDFWRVAIRPGKPLAYGRFGDAIFFGLPGNPVSSLVTFELFVRPLLRKMAGFSKPLRPTIPATLTEPLPHEPGRREFARAEVTWKNGICLATPTGRQGSHRLSSMIGANALLIAREEHEDYAAGEVLDALLLIGS